MGDIFSNTSQRPSVPPPPTGMVVGGSSPQPSSSSSWITPGATCVGRVLREADARKDGRRCGGAGGLGELGDQSACGIGPSLGEGERNKGRWWKHFGQHSSSRRVLQDCRGVFKPKWLVRGILGLIVVDLLRVPAICWKPLVRREASESAGVEFRGWYLGWPVSRAPVAGDMRGAFPCFPQGPCPFFHCTICGILAS